MGTIQHHAIVVTSESAEHIEEAYAEATRIFPWVSPLSPSVVNGYRSFFVPPDGSKERWAESDKGDARRDSFVRYLESKRYEDGSTRLDWVEVAYGEWGTSVSRTDCIEP